MNQKYSQGQEWLLKVYDASSKTWQSHELLILSSGHRIQLVHSNFQVVYFFCSFLKKIVFLKSLLITFVYLPKIKHDSICKIIVALKKLNVGKNHIKILI